jgi:carboxylesterase
MAADSHLVNAHLEGGPAFWQGGKQGILLLHGFTATTSEVRWLGERLNQHGYTVSCPLLPGHGSSPEELNRCRWQNWAAAAETAYQALSDKTDDMAVGGESMGGLLALYLAARHPTLKAGLIYAPALQFQNRYARWMAQAVRIFKPYMPKNRPSNSTADSRWQGYRVDPVAAALQLMQLQDEVRKELARITQPLLILQGRRDRLVAPSVPGQIAAAVKSSRVEIQWMERSSHCVILDDEWEQAAAHSYQFLKNWLPVRA